MSSFKPQAKRQTKADLVKGKTLVGQRIPENTPLGKSLAQLRTAYACAAEITLPQEDLRRRIMETSLNVEAPLDLLAAKKVKVQRTRLIRERVQTVIDGIYDREGRYPATVGLPRDSFDEIREACYDFPVTFVLMDTA